jgi:hypothetical protein
MSKLDFLTNLPRDQTFICLSFLTNKESNHTVTGVRFGGAFSTYEAACKQAKEIQQLDKYHHVFVGEGGKWLPFDPDPNSEAVKDSEYADARLNELMKGHKESQEKAKLFHEMRKNEKMIENINDNLVENQKNKDELTEKLSSATTIEDVQTLTSTIDNVDEQIKKMEERLKECKTNYEHLHKQTMS